MSKATLLQLALPAAAAFAAGLWLRSGGNSAPEAVAKSAAPPPPASRPPREKVLPLDAAELAALKAAGPEEQRQLLLCLLPRASEAEISAIANWLPQADKAAWDMLLLRWNEISPQSLAAYVDEHLEFPNRKSALVLLAESAPELLSDSISSSKEIAEAFLEVDVGRALDEWLVGSFSLSVGTDAIRRMGHAAFLDWSGRHPETTEDQERDIQRWRRLACSDWLKAAPDAALAYASKAQGSLRAPLLSAFVPALAATNCPEAVKWMDSLPPEGLAFEARAAVLAELARIDLDGALSRIRTRFTDDAELATLGAKLIKALANDLNPAALRILQELPPDASFFDQHVLSKYSVGPALNNLFLIWAQKDPIAALAGIKTLPTEVDALLFCRALLAGWYRKSPAEALDAIPQVFPDSEDRVASERSDLIHRWAGEDPEAVLRYIATLADPRQRAEDQRSFFWFCAGSGSWITIEDYLPRLSPAAVAADVGKHVAESARYRPASTERRIREMPAEWQLILQCGYHRGLVRADARHTTTAAEFLSQNAAAIDPSWAGPCVEDVAREWTSQEPAAASGWVNSWQGPLRNHAIQGLLAGMDQTDPATGPEMFAWAAAMTPSNHIMAAVQKQCLLESLARWATSDSAAARDAVLRSNLSNKEDLISVIDHPPSLP